MQKSKMFFCVGAQKGGTSWLYRNLMLHPSFNMPPVKELHFFDELEAQFPNVLWTIFFSKKETIQKRRIKRMFNFWRKRGKLKEKHKNILKIALLRRQKANIPVYKKYLESFSKGGFFTGDMTPAYSYLTKETIQLVYDAFPKATVFFILRDPIEREWSASKMYLLKHRGKTAGDFVHKEFMDYFKGVQKRSHYLPMLENWGSIFPSEQFKIFFFDDLKKDNLAFINKVCQFLKAPELELLPEVAIPNKGIKLPITEEFEKMLFDKFKPDVLQLADFFKDYPVNYPQQWLEKYQAKYPKK